MDVIKNPMFFVACALSGLSYFSPWAIIPALGFLSAYVFSSVVKENKRALAKVRKYEDRLSAVEKAVVFNRTR